MTTYIIGYDLTKKDGHDYTNLIEAIKSYPDWWHYLDSTWVVVTNQSAVQIRDALKAHMHQDDELLVVQSSGVGAWSGFDTTGSEWLKNKL